MDSLVIAISITTFLIFLLIHLVVLRRINKKSIVKWIVYIYIITSLIALIIVVTANFTSEESWLLPLSGISLPPSEVFLSLILYTLMVAIYVMGFLGVMMTSVRIRLLGLIAAEGEKIGISTAKILKQYNKRIIIKNRLSRLLASGDLRKSDGYYSLGRRFSYFYFHNWITSLFRRFYN